MLKLSSMKEKFHPWLKLPVIELHLWNNIYSKSLMYNHSTIKHLSDVDFPKLLQTERWLVWRASDRPRGPCSCKKTVWMLNWTSYTPSTRIAYFCMPIYYFLHSTASHVSTVESVTKSSPNKSLRRYVGLVISSSQSTPSTGMVEHANLIMSYYVMDGAKCGLRQHKPCTTRVPETLARSRQSE